MKIKGIPFWEQHIEHFVFGFAVLVFGAFAAMQFTGSPNAVSVGGKDIGPGEVDPLLEARAAEIGQDIAGSPVEIPDQMPVLPKFVAARSASVSPEPSLAPWSPALAVEGGTIPPNRPFAVASIPAPSEIRVERTFDTLNAEIVTEFPALAKYVPNTPRDITWNTVAAKFAIGSIRDQYSKPGPNGEAPIPPRWCNNYRVDIFDLRIERQEQMPDGSWGSAVVLLDPIPGQVSYREVIAKPADVKERNKIIAEVGDPAIRTQIIQPEFYPTISNQWSPPAMGGGGANAAEAVAAKPGEDPAIAELKGKLARDQRELERQKKLLKENNCPEAPEAPDKPGPGKPPPPPAGGKGGGGAPGPGSGVGVGAGTAMRDPSAKKADESVCRKFRKKIKDLELQIQKTEAELAKFQVVIEPKVEAPKAEEGQPDEILVWGHDLAIVPGHTYRYRMAVDVYNPLFGRKADLIEVQRGMAEKLFVSSKTSEWSAPMTAQPPLRVFITQARPAGLAGGITNNQGLGNATAEVFRFRDGRWWRQSFSVQPGDRIGEERATRVAEARSAPKEKPDPKPDAGGKPKAGAGAGGAGDAGGVNSDKETAAPPPPPVQIDFATDWFVLDVVEDIGADQRDAERGMGAIVLLQSLSSAEVIQYRVPRADSVDPELRRLREELRFSEGSSGAIAKAG